MRWDIIFQAKNLALYWEGLVTTASLLASSLLIGAVLALIGMAKCRVDAVYDFERVGP